MSKQFLFVIFTSALFSFIYFSFFIFICKKNYFPSIAITEIKRMQQSQLKNEIMISSNMYHLYKAALLFLMLQELRKGEEVHLKS